MKRARKAGATDEEIAEAVFVGIAMSTGAAVAHACVAMEALGAKNIRIAGRDNRDDLRRPSSREDIHPSVFPAVRLQPPEQGTLLSS